MEEMASLWSYQEALDELRQKLLYTNLELEQLKAENKDQIMKNKEYVKQLIQILNTVCQERDEAKDQLQKLMMNSTKANSSSITDQSNSLSSETYNYHNSHDSSPKIDSFFDSVASPECSNNNCRDHDCNVQFLDNCVTQLAPKVDKASLVIDNLVKGKTLPQQGKLLQAVIETGPILQTLLVSGQLPQWRNPPQVTPFNVPPVCVKGCGSDIANQNLGANLNYFDMSCGSSQMVSTSMLNFANFDSGSCLENQSLMSAGADLNSFVLGKRQRLH